MDKDIAPGLIDSVNDAFEKNCIKDPTMKSLARKLEKGEAGYEDAYKYAVSVGNARSKAFKSEVSSNVLPDGRMYYNIADRLMEDSLTTDHNMVADYAEKVQKVINDNAGINLKAQRADLDQDRIRGFVERLSDEDNYDDVAWILDEPVKVHAMSVVDDTIKKNAEFQNKAGIKATVSRDTVADCCPWCKDLAGDYIYPNVPKDIFARHDNCRCILEYQGNKLSAYGGGKGHSFRDQNEIEKSKSRKEYNQSALKNIRDYDKVKSRKGYSEVDLIKREFIKHLDAHPEMLGEFTPESLKKALELANYDVKPLSKGSLRNVSFEDGGGYKVNYGGNGILSYHPKEHSHHKDAYYKISNSIKGTKRYDLSGKEIIE